jgi:hypothetical protein
VHPLLRKIDALARAIRALARKPYRARVIRNFGK